MAAVTPAQLDYAHEPTAARRRRTRRAVWAVSLLAVALVAAKWAPPAWQHARLLHWQGKCLAYAPAQPARPVVAGSVDQEHVACWREFYALFSPPGRNRLGTVFLHEMRRKDGQRRLVVLESKSVTGLGANPDSEVELEYHVIEPGTPWRRPRLLANAPIRPHFFYEGGEGAHFDVLPGRIDPADASHFTVDVRYRGRTITLDGWLTEGDALLLEPRESLSQLRVARY
jgi:hypothetical protein